MQAAGNIILDSPDGSFGPVVARNSEVLVSNPGRVRCVSSRLCIYSAPNCSKAWSAQCCLWYYMYMHYKEPLKSFDKNIEYSFGFGLRSVAILP